MTIERRAAGLMLGAMMGVAGCGGRDAPCVSCGTVVIAATGEPQSLVPPLVFETVGRDIEDQVFERLAVLKPGSAPIDTAAYQPALATKWERIDSLTWRFHLRPGAQWHDGKPVTAEDVVFSFEAFADSTLESAALSTLAGRVHARAEDASTVVVAFTESYPEQFYDATYHVRIMPRHVWASVPRAAWMQDTTIAHLVGSGPYRVVEWRRGEHLTLAADTASPSAIRRVVWRFTGDADAALNLVLAHEADLLEAVIPPTSVPRVEADSALRAVRYPSAVYGFVGFNVARAGSPLADAKVRRALASGTPRQTIATAVFGADARVPGGPMSRLLWLWSDSAGPAYDTTAANRLLDESGWKREGAAGMRRRGGKALAVDILVPTSSTSRVRAAELMQQAWKALGVAVTVTPVEFPVLQERLEKQRFDAYVGAYLDEPSPRSIAGQWTRAGWAELNYTRYASPAFDTLFARAGRATGVADARRMYREALDTLVADAPAIFLYTPTNVAAVQRRLDGVSVDPYSWLSGLSRWQVKGDR